MKTIFYLDISLCLQRITTSAHQDNFKAKIGVMFTGTKFLARFFISGSDFCQSQFSSFL